MFRNIFLTFRYLLRNQAMIPQKYYEHSLIWRNIGCKKYLHKSIALLFHNIFCPRKKIFGYMNGINGLSTLPWLSSHKSCHRDWFLFKNSTQIDFAETLRQVWMLHTSSYGVNIIVFAWIRLFIIRLGSFMNVCLILSFS